MLARTQSQRKRKRSAVDDGSETLSTAKQLQAASALLKFLPSESNFLDQYRALHIDSAESREATLRLVLGREALLPSAPSVPAHTPGDMSARLRDISRSYGEWAQAEEQSEVYMKHLNAFRKVVRVSMCQVLHDQDFEFTELVKYAPRGRDGLPVSEKYLRRLLHSVVWSHKWIDRLSRAGWGEMAFDLPYILGATPSLYDKAYCVDSNAIGRQIVQALTLRMPPECWFENAKAFYMPLILFEIFQKIFSLCYLESTLGYQLTGLCKCEDCSQTNSEEGPEAGSTICNEAHGNAAIRMSDTLQAPQDQRALPSVPCLTPFPKDSVSDKDQEDQSQDQSRSSIGSRSGDSTHDKDDASSKQTQTGVGTYHSFSLGMRSKDALQSILGQVLENVIESKQWQKEEAVRANGTACVTVIVPEVAQEDVTLSFRIGRLAGASLIRELNMQLGSSLF